MRKSYRSYAFIIISVCYVLIVESSCEGPKPKPQPIRGAFKSSTCGFVSTNNNPIPTNLKQPDARVLGVIKALLTASGMGQNYENRNFYINSSDSVNVPEAVIAPLTLHENDLYLHRFILYNQREVDSLLRFVSPAVGYVLFAHELSHHLSGDNLAEESPQLKLQRELAADSFAGYLCYRIQLNQHFKLSDCLKIYDALASGSDTLGYPSRARRKFAFEVAWQSAEITEHLNCEALSKLPETPVPFMQAFYDKNHAFIDTVRERFARTITQTWSRLSFGKVNQTAINLRGAPTAYVQKKNGSIWPVAAPDSLSTKPLVKTTERIPVVPDKNQYIIDKANVIWARYPNGVPYIAGFAKQAIK